MGTIIMATMEIITMAIQIIMKTMATTEITNKIIIKIWH